MKTNKNSSEYINDEWENPYLIAFILFLLLLIEIPFIPFVFIWAWIDDIRNKLKNKNSSEVE